MCVNSTFIFVVPASESNPHDMVLVKAEPVRARFIVYDANKERKSTQFGEQICLLQTFVEAYIEEYGNKHSFSLAPVDASACESEQGEDEQEDGVFDKPSVNKWDIQDGICTKVSA